MSKYAIPISELAVGSVTVSLMVFGLWSGPADTNSVKNTLLSVHTFEITIILIIHQIYKTLFRGSKYAHLLIVVIIKSVYEKYWLCFHTMHFNTVLLTRNYK